MDQELLNVRDLQEILRVSRSTAYAILKEGRIFGIICSGVNKDKVVRSVFFGWLEENMVRCEGIAAGMSYYGERFTLNPRSVWQSQPEWMKVEEVVDLTGFSRTAFFRMVKKKQVPGAVRIGGSWRINRDVLVRWIFGEVRG